MSTSRMPMSDIFWGRWYPTKLLPRTRSMTLSRTVSNFSALASAYLKKAAFVPPLTATFYACGATKVSSTRSPNSFTRTTLKTFLPFSVAFTSIKVCVSIESERTWEASDDPYLVLGTYSNSLKWILSSSSCYCSLNPSFRTVSSKKLLVDFKPVGLSFVPKSVWWYS